jgi:hypothetical protein
LNLRELILATPFKPELKPVPVPQWPGTDGRLFVKTLSAHEHERYLKISNRHDTDDNVCFYAEITALVLCDEHGAPVFTSPADVTALAGKDITPLQIVVDTFTDHVKEVAAKKKADGRHKRTFEAEYLIALDRGFLHPDHMKQCIGESEYGELLNHLIESGHLNRIRNRDDWRDQTLALIAFFLSVMASGGKLGKPFELDSLQPPYLKSKKPTKTPEQRVKEAELMMRARRKG